MGAKKTGRSEYEVESKYRIIEFREIEQIIRRLARRKFLPGWFWQEDLFLPSDDPEINPKVRTEVDAKGKAKRQEVTKTKEKIEGGNGTQRERKRRITRSELITLVSDAWPDGQQPGVQKLRLEWSGMFDHLAVKVCIDYAVSSADGRVLGWFVEFEAEVQTAAEVPAARRKLNRLAKAVLGGNRKPVKRGYRKRVMDGKGKNKSAKE